jgi:hypothetical protein
VEIGRRQMMMNKKKKELMDGIKWKHVCATKMKWGNVQHTFIVIRTVFSWREWVREREKGRTVDGSSKRVDFSPLRSALNFLFSSLSPLFPTLAHSLFRNNFLMICIFMTMTTSSHTSEFEWGRKLTSFFLSRLSTFSHTQFFFALFFLFLELIFQIFNFFWVLR